MKTELDITAATEKARLEPATYSNGHLTAAISFRVNAETEAFVGVRRTMPAEQGEAWAGFIDNIAGAVEDGKLDLTDLAKVGLSSDLGKLF